MKIGFIGDLILSPKLVIDEQITALLRRNDFNVANLEAPFIKKEMHPEMRSGLHQLVSGPGMLHDLNIKAVSLANNHILDYGPEGIEFTQQVLAQHEIQFFGAGSSLEEALRPARLLLDNQSLDIWGFMQRFYSKRHFATSHSEGTAELKKEAMIRELESSDADIKIVYNHWNLEMESFPEPVNKDLAEELARHSTLVVGSHPHCIQGIQTAGNALIFHSLGNFSMPALDYSGTTLIEYPEISRESLIITVALDGTPPPYDIHPIILDRSGTVVSSPDKEKRAQILSRVHRLSEPLALGYNHYRQFYKQNKTRKLMPTQVKNRHLNRFRLFSYFSFIRMLQFVEGNLARFLRKIGLLDRVKRWFSGILDYIHANR